MALRFTGYEKQQFAKRPTASVEAYEAYLMGIYFWNKRSEEALTKSVGYFQRATELDRNFAGAYAYMADAYAMTAANRYGERPDVALYERARAAATRALELDDTVPEAYLALSLVAFNLDRDSERAARLLKRTVSLNPNNAVARLRYGWHLAREGQLSDAVAELRMAQRLNPLSAHHNTSLAAILLFARDYDGAVGYAQRAIEIDPNYYTARLNLAEAYEMKGMYADALAELKKLRGSPREDAYTRAYMGRLLALSGDDGEARKVLAGLESQAGGSNALHYNMALIYSALGQRNETFRMLDKAITERIILAEVLRFDPRLDQLRSDPGYEEVLRRHNLSHLLPSTAPLQRPVKAEAAQTPAVVSWHTQGSGLPPRKP